MNKTSKHWLLMICSLTIGLFFFYDTAESARRLGGGRSFGSKPSYQRSAPPPSQKPSPTQTKPEQTVQPQSPLPSNPMGRFGGMLGGMLMGGLIGSLLFGGGHGFSGPGLLDLLLVGGGLFLLVRFLRARRMAAAPASGTEPMDFGRGPSQAWGSGQALPSDDSAMTFANQPVLPPGFDAEEFLKGANAIYIRLQAAWDKRDLEDIRMFTAPEVFAEIQRQADEDPRPGKTELLLINPRIIEVRDVNHQTIVTVLYDVTMRENEAELPKQVRELWHFSRDREGSAPFWVLEGIQQME